MDNKTYRGSAINDGVVLAAPLNVGDLSAQITGGSLTGWPTGADSRVFVVEVDTDKDAEERILCSTLTGPGPATVTIVERGYDGTTEVDHSANATFAHVLDAEFADETVLHIVDDTRDDHGQYLTEARHDTPDRHAFTDGATIGAYGTPATPAPIGRSIDNGTDPFGPKVGASGGPPHADHVHVLGAGAIDDPAMFAAAVVPPSALQDGIDGATLLANSLPASALNIGLDAVIDANSTTVQAADDTHALLPPDPATVSLWRQGDKSRLYIGDGTHWRWLAGKPVKCALSYHGDGSGIANGFGAHDLNQFTADSDEFAMASGGGLLTIPNAVGGPPPYAFDGEWDVIWSILVSNAGSTAAAALQLQLVTDTLTYALNLQPNAPSHSTLLKGRTTVSFLAAATAKLALAHSAPGNVQVLNGSTFELRYRGVA